MSLQPGEGPQTATRRKSSSSGRWVDMIRMEIGDGVSKKRRANTAEREQIKKEKEAERERAERASIFFGEALKRKVQRLADEERRTFSAMVRLIVENAIDRLEREKKSRR